MKNNNLTVFSRIVMAFATGMLVAVFFLPAWRIDLFAPQYPEGLKMNIWLDRLTGDVDIINGLNHYIGMKPFSNESFPEFGWLKYVVYFFIAMGLLISLTGKKRLLILYLILTAIGGTLAMYDFYKWGYEFGHDLDPKAAIQVPGMSYQPPVFGHKRLLNFDSYSFPDIGGWLVISSAILAFLILVYEWYLHRKPKTTSPVAVLLITGALSATLSACQVKPEPLVSGQDMCFHCKMTIVEPRYGCEIVTQKGKVYKFDDFSCMKSFIRSNTVKQEEIRFTLVADFNNEKDWLPAETAIYYTGPLMKSPMGSNTGAFPDQAEASRFKGENEGTLSDWNGLMQSQ
ncbi:MAG TPA: nitrous oxide reductase accessory protein NosL [Saprospiraceae bacterium]|nr:nitrous oxide reductase accessory protein NosL [Saprospiraceae bacterium]HNT20097.1 nitrous oxide reductase accessory protein NosL [Saprospiraceae bacterium]